MKKIFFLWICVIGLLLTGCSPKELQSSPYKVYVDYSLGANDESAVVVGNDNLKVFGVSEKNFSVNTKEEKFQKSELANESIRIGQTGPILGYSCSRTLSLAETEKEELKKLSITDVYIGDGHQAEYDVYGRLRFYINYDDEVRMATGDLTEAEAKAKAEEYLVSFYGEDVLTQYNFERVTAIDKAITHTGFVVSFRRYIHDYKTDDIIEIRINEKGELVSVKADKIGVYDYARKSVSKEQLLAAETVLKDSLSENYNPSVGILTMDSKGDLYIQMTLTHVSFGSASGNSESLGIESLRLAYINVQ